MKRVSSFIYRQKNKFSHKYARLKTILWYRIFFGKIGAKSTFYSPIRLISPENIFLGKRVHIYKNSRIETVRRVGHDAPKITIGDGTSFEQNLHMTCAHSIEIGRETVILADVMITDIDHQYEKMEENVLCQPLLVQSVKIGEFCFIGMNAKIFPGTVLGDGCIVGANAIVRGHFPDHCVLVGTPARIVKRFDQDKGIWRKTNEKGEFVENE